MDIHEKIVVLPHLGEFGWLIMTHIRYFNRLQAREKIAVCQPGHECLFPSATGFFTDWQNPIPDKSRCRDGKYGDGQVKSQFYRSLKNLLAKSFPTSNIIEPQYDCHWHMSDGEGYKFKPIVECRLPIVDVVVSPRMRDFEPSRNWQHWPMIIDKIRSAGFPVGIAGQKATTFPCGADAFAWDHPEGDTAGSLDMLLRSRLYVGTDSGVTHLAALCDVPTIIVKPPVDHNERGPLQRANKSGFFKVVEAWDNPDRFIAEVLDSLHPPLPSGHNRVE
jgi:hypothetical protein